MDSRGLLEKSIHRQTSELLDLPEEVLIGIDIVYDDLMKSITKGTAPLDRGDTFGGDVNIIPSKHKSVCTPILITFCYDKDNFEQRILDSLDHATIICNKKCEVIYFLTTQWNSFTFNKLSGYVESVRSHNVRVSFIYITNKGITIMPC
jgi:hypothetical protein